MLSSSHQTSESQDHLQSTRRHPCASPFAQVPILNIENSVRALSKQSTDYEHQLRELDSKLTEGLTNFREIEGILHEVFTGLQRTSKRTDRAVNSLVPQITNKLDESMDTLEDLSETLPTVQKQLHDITNAYRSGSEKADQLVADLQWLNTDFYERWRRIIFTKDSPVSWRWKVYIRTIFILSFIVCSWLFWITLTGAYRAHRHRLVWGEKLMS